MGLLGVGQLIAAILLFIAQAQAQAQPSCIALHYGREGYAHEVSMARVLHNRLSCPGPSCIPGFRPRGDVQDYIAVRYADRWRIALNYRALVVFKLPGGGVSKGVWLQPIDYQARQDVTSNRCRVETSEKLAASQGWSMYANNEGRTTAYIIEWQK